MLVMPERKQLRPRDRAAWRRWLERNHAGSPGVLLVLKKKSAAGRGLGYEDAVEEALCFGWIDSKVRSLDESYTQQLFTPRKTTSPWSKLNKERVKKLASEGRMAPAGRQAIERAKRNGSWTMLDSVEALEIPKDLATALARNKKAATNFEAFSPSAKKGYLYWINGAKRSETRARRIRETVALAAKNVKSRL
jgi:uncharacterized protein YdeI (YjbR/CyaY-like superfamily)